MSSAIMNVYCEHYQENCAGKYWEEEKVLPYMVLNRSKEEREDFRRFLESEGFKCVTWNDRYPGILVNMRFRRFGLIHYACHFSCVDDRNYSISEFLSEVYNAESPQ